MTDALERKILACKANTTKADELACDICELEGGDALVEGTDARNEIFSWVWRQPEYDHAARRKIFAETI